MPKKLKLNSSFFFQFNFLTLQYCIGFAIHQHASTMGVHVFLSWNPLPPPSPYHPYGSSQCTSPKPPVSCTEPGLTIRFLYDIIHVLMPFSQIIPPPFPLPQSPKDCSIHLCLLATPVFFPGISHGRRSLVGYSPCGRKEVDMTEWLHFHFFIFLLKFSLLCFKGLVTYHPIATVHDHKNGEWLGIELWPRTHI